MFRTSKICWIARELQSRHIVAAPAVGDHTLVHGDSNQLTFTPGFGLLITSPPAFHPTHKQPAHGHSFVGRIEEYVETVSSVLVRCSNSVDQRRMCLVKTDIWHNGTLLPIGFELARACISKGLKLRAHFVARRTPSFTPYGPTFSNIFFFAETLVRPQCVGILDVPSRRKKGCSSSFAPELFTTLIHLFARSGDVLLDPFAGAGSVIHAGIASKRASVGVEISAAQIKKACMLLRAIKTPFKFNLVSKRSSQ